VKLSKNFRSHQHILKFPNERFYNGDLEACGDRKTIDFLIGSPLLASPTFPIVFHAITGKDMREASSPSFFNIEEVTQVKDYVQKLRADRRFRISTHIYFLLATLLMACSVLHDSGCGHRCHHALPRPMPED
jgi:helicase MOV-10